MLIQNYILTAGLTIASFTYAQSNRSNSFPMVTVGIYRAFSQPNTIFFHHLCTIIQGGILECQYNVLLYFSTQRYADYRSENCDQDRHVELERSHIFLNNTETAVGYNYRTLNMIGKVNKEWRRGNFAKCFIVDNQSLHFVLKGNSTDDKNNSLVTILRFNITIEKYFAN